MVPDLWRVLALSRTGMGPRRTGDPGDIDDNRNARLPLDEGRGYSHAHARPAAPADLRLRSGPRRLHRRALPSLRRAHQPLTPPRRHLRAVTTVGRMSL